MKIIAIFAIWNLIKMDYTYLHIGWMFDAFFWIYFFLGVFVFWGKIQKKKGKIGKHFGKLYFKIYKTLTVLNKSSCGVYFTDNDVSGLSPIYIPATHW